MLKKLPIPGVGEVERSRLGIGDEMQLLRRYSSSETQGVWFVVDDIDATFKNTELNRTHLAAFFSACRDLVQKVKGLTIRVAVRTDVWTLLRGADEALDKCDQYVFNLRWSTEQVAYILVSKVDAYFQVKLKIPWVPNQSEVVRKSQAFNTVFQPKFPWGRDKQIDSQTYVALYSQGRPRWSAALCRQASLTADARGHLKIDEPDFRSVLATYSAQRRLDIVGEHSQEFKDFNGLIQIFSGWKRSFKTQEMLSRISNEYLKKVVASDSRSVDAVQLAHLLFRSGVINAVSNGGQRGARRMEYEDRPTLLTSRAALDEGFDWEIPMFLRAALKLGY